jgi:hypothetical protein
MLHSGETNLKRIWGEDWAEYDKEYFNGCLIVGMIFDFIHQKRLIIE